MTTSGVSVRVQRTAGEAAETLRRLNEMAVAARKGLDGVDDALERLHRRRDAVQQQLTVLDRPAAADDGRAGALRQQLDQLNREIAEAERRRSEQQQAPTPSPTRPGEPATATPPPPPPRRALTPEERQRLAASGTYSAPELARATWVRPPTDPNDPTTGTLFVPPPRAEGPRAPSPRRPPTPPPPPAARGGGTDAGGVAARGGYGTPDAALLRQDGEQSPGTSPGNRGMGGGARSEEARKVDETADEYRDLAASTRLTALSSRELRYEWEQNARALGRQHREIDKTVTELDRLQGKKKTARRDDEIERLVERRRDLQVGRATLDGERERLQRELESRGLRVGSGGILLGSSDGRGAHEAALGGQRPTLRQLAGTVAGGAGLGGGSPGGLAISAALGWLNPWTAAATAAGMAGGYMFSDGGRANQLRRLVFDAGMRGGGGFQGIYDDALGGMSAPYFLRPEESIEARMALGTQTGRTDVEEIAALARAYGLPPGAVAAMIGRVGTLGALPLGATGRQRRVGGIDPPAALPQPAIAPPRQESQSGHDRGVQAARNLQAYLVDTAPTRDDVRNARRRGANAARELLGFFGLGSSPMEQDRPPVGRAATDEVQLTGGEVLLGTAGAASSPGRSNERRFTSRGDGSSGIAGILAGAYGSSAYRGLPGDRRDLLMQSFLQQWSRLSNVQQSAGGMPIQNWETVPAMLSTATRYFGKDISPEIPAARVSAFMEGFQRPRGPIMQGIQLRGIRDMAEGMTPEQLAEFKRTTKGVDLTTHAGRIEAMQNTFSLPPREMEMVLRAQMAARRRVVGSGTEAEQWMIADAHTGGQMGPARDIQRLQNKLLYARQGSEESVGLVEEIQRKMSASGDFGQLFRNELLGDESAIRATDGIKALGQSIKGSVLNLTRDVIEALDAWNAGVGVQPGMRGE